MDRPEAEKKALRSRARRIEGQVSGIVRMLDEDRYCPEILNTIAAVHAALRSLEAKLLEDHVRHCVAQAIVSQDGAAEKLDELVKLYKRRLSA